MNKVKITVLKTTLDKELALEYCSPDITPCPMMSKGQVFFADYAKPQGFCDEAWKTIYQYDIDIVNITLHFFLKDVRSMLPPAVNHSISVS